MDPAGDTAWGLETNCLHGGHGGHHAPLATRSDQAGTGADRIGTVAGPEQVARPERLLLSPPLAGHRQRG